MITDIEAKPAVLLYFYNDGCQPCLALRPKIAHLISNEFPQIECIFINAVQHPEVTAKYGVFSSPTLIFIFEGKEYRRYNMYVSISSVKDEITRPYNLMFNSNPD